MLGHIFVFLQLLLRKIGHPQASRGTAGATLYLSTADEFSYPVIDHSILHYLDSSLLHLAFLHFKFQEPRLRSLQSVFEQKLFGQQSPSKKVMKPGEMLKLHGSVPSACQL